MTAERDALDAFLLACKDAGIAAEKMNAAIRDVATLTAPAAEPVDDCVPITELVKWILHYYGWQPNGMGQQEKWLYKLADHIHTHPAPSESSPESRGEVVVPRPEIEVMVAKSANTVVQAIGMVCADGSNGKRAVKMIDEAMRPIIALARSTAPLAAAPVAQKGE